MKYISETLSSRLISHELAFNAVSAAFIAASEQAALFPVVIAQGHAPGSIFSLKSANTVELTGWKAGSYWPGNVEKNIPCHASTIFLLNPETGYLDAVIEGSAVNAYRTAAADAVAVSKLAREDAQCLVIFGTGHQAFYECLAVSKVRNIKTILVVGRDQNKAQILADKLNEQGLSAHNCDAQSACRRADIIVTATTATSPLFAAEWIKPGTHISAMGADTNGKQELPAELLESAKLYCDFTTQSRVIGEFQHLGQKLLHQPQMIGHVLNGKAAGRVNNSEITVFDSSGIAVQDLFIGRHLLTAAVEAGFNITAG
ncbi:ornithine cyclodeaminase family protein [Psychromonas ossibalaenae]|uniref:ornithine cyclodeaminase family protein n=1 Tax=Psychromonas ossibalaenae TaxID=444922 RepID=UPI00035D67FF|nr:ornithine cyclodeaminase family protein [Psychromonas ossibalaenae]